MSLFIESLLAASLFFVSLLVLCAASLLVVVELWLWASAGFAGVAACDISFGVAELLSALGVVASGVAVVSGVVVVVVEFVVVLLAPLFL